MTANITKEYYLVQIITGELAGQTIRKDAWHTWIGKMDNLELCCGLALHKYIRERGGLLDGDRLTVNVLIGLPQDGYYPDGNPKSCMSSKYICTPK